MVGIQATVAALYALAHDTVQHGATLITPRRTKVGVGLELVGSRFLGSGGSGHIL